MNKSYEKGKRFEYEVRDLLRLWDFFVIRQAKSSFPDLIAIRKTTGKTVCVECRFNGNIKKEEKDFLLKLHKNYGMHPYLAYREKREVKFLDLLFDEVLKNI